MGKKSKRKYKIITKSRKGGGQGGQKFDPKKPFFDPKRPFFGHNREFPLGKISPLLRAHLTKQGNGPRRPLLNFGAIAGSASENFTTRTVTSTEGSIKVKSTQVGDSNQSGAERQQSSSTPNNTQKFHSYNRTWRKPSGPYTENTTQIRDNKNRPGRQHPSLTEQTYTTHKNLRNESERPTGHFYSNPQSLETQNPCYNENLQNVGNEPWTKIVSYYKEYRTYDIPQQPNEHNMTTGNYHIPHQPNENNMPMPPGSSDMTDNEHPNMQQSTKKENMFERIIIADDYPFTLLDFDKFDDIQVAIFKKLENAPEPLPIIRMKFDEKGYIPVTCKGARSVNFIQSFNGQTIADNLKIKIVSANNLPKPIKMVWKSRNIICTDIERIMRMLQRCNPDLRTSNWTVIDTLPEETHVRRIIMVDGVSAAYIQSKNYIIPDGLGQSIFKILLDAKKPRKRNKAYYSHQNELRANDEMEHLEAAHSAPLDDSVIIQVDTTPTIDLTNEDFTGEL